MASTSFVRAIGMSLIALISVMAPRHAAGYFLDGNQLVSYMREFEKAVRGSPNTNWTKNGLYIGYVMGVTDSLSAVDCVSGSISNSQIGSVVALYLNDHPAEWSAPAAQLVATALMQAFPCR